MSLEKKMKDLEQEIQLVMDKLRARPYSIVKPFNSHQP